MRQTVLLIVDDGQASQEARQFLGDSDISFHEISHTESFKARRKPAPTMIVRYYPRGEYQGLEAIKTAVCRLPIY